MEEVRERRLKELRETRLHRQMRIEELRRKAKQREESSGEPERLELQELKASLVRSLVLCT